MAQRLTRPALRTAAAFALALALLLSALPARAQADVRSFPETGHTLRGAFRVFWETNGGLYTFGLPITEEFVAPSGKLTQWFERARFELGGSGAQWRVDLGNLGVEATQGRIFPKSPPVPDTPTRRYIAETQHVIQHGFKEIWETRGAQAIFGFPISEEIQEILDDGEWHTVQYFERARFEYWPDRPAGQRVLISHLGRKLAPADRLAPVPAPGQPARPPAPSPTPAPGAAVPPARNATVTPQSGPPGTTFAFDARGFEPGERVGIWITAPDQSTYGADFQASADASGAITGARVGLATDASFPEGLWSFNAQGVRSKREAVGYFRITRAATTRGTELVVELLVGK
jgi:hypothetical protein